MFEWAGIIAIWLIVLVFLLIFLKIKFIVASDYKSAVDAAFGLQSRGFVPVINMLGEHYTDRNKVERTLTQYFYLVDLIRGRGLKAKISVKPTQIGLAISKELYLYNICRLARRANNQKVPLEIDVEDARHLGDILGAYWEIPGEFDVRQAVQAYFKRSVDEVEKFISLHRKIRLVKGAYSESDLDKDEQERQFFNLAVKLICESHDQAIATVRDKNFIHSILLVCHKYAHVKNNFSFQMLYGRTDKLKRELRDEGFHVEIYMPVGPWHKALPYVWRRIKEVAKSPF